jgi:hypothetical protein
MRRKKRGSSLVTVILVFGILFTVGTAAMALSLSDVKMRVNESKRVQNLYGSESGLEEAYGIFSNYADEAIKVGNDKVKNYLATLNEENGLIAQEKQKFNNGETYNANYINNDGTVNEKYIKDNIDIIFKEGYKENFANKIKDILGNKSGYVIGNKDTSPRVNIKNLKSEEVTFDILNNLEEMKINLHSAYHEIDNNGFKNQREVESTFKISVPKYDAPYSVETEKISLPENSIRGKTLVTNSNLELNTNSNLSLQGDVYVLGSNDLLNTTTGIIINGQNSNLSLKDGKIVSKGDTKIQGGSSTIIGDDKSTLYTGSLSIEKSAVASKVDIKGTVYANNDLTLNGEKSNINIYNGFYGINDIRRTNIGEKRRNSSSIIVNAKDIGEKNGSSITIEKELVLLGTAYIDTKPESYQTGESVAIKGNYKAYTSTLDSADKLNKDNIIFDYLSPLQLANKFKNGEELTLEDKNNYFMAYYNNKRDTLKLNGIQLPDKILTLGVIVNNGRAEGGNYYIDNDTIKNSINAYESKVGEITSLDKYINFSAINETINKLSNYEGLKELVYISKENKNLYISDEKGFEQKADEINLDNTKAKGVIITNGDVYIKGNINFEGTIISNGKIIIEDGAKVNLNSNKKMVDYIVAKNYKHFTGIFKNDSPNSVNNIEIDASAIIENTLQNMSKQNIIKTTNWRIVK